MVRGLRNLMLPAVGLFAAIVLSGCGAKDDKIEKLPTVPASGFVTYKGKPVADASVSFVSLDNKTRAGGRTDGVGSFTLTTYGTEQGAPPGKYRVTVAVSASKEIEPGVLEDEPPGGFKSPIPVKYANPQTTDILVEIKEGDRNEFTIKLE